MYGKCQKILSHYYEPFESYSRSKSTGAIIAPPPFQPPKDKIKLNEIFFKNYGPTDRQTDRQTDRPTYTIR